MTCSFTRNASEDEEATFSMRLKIELDTEGS